MIFIVDKNWIDVIGHIWRGNLCAYSYILTPAEVKAIGKATRKNVEAFLWHRAGDFESILDFHAVVGEIDLPWRKSDMERMFNKISKGTED